MRRLIGFEWRKTFLRLPVFILLVLLTVADIAKIYSVYLENSYLAEVESWNFAYWQLYDSYVGEITQEKIHSLLDMYRPLEEKTADLTATTAFGVEGTLTGNIWSDKNFLSRYFVSPMQYSYTYQNLAGKVHLKAKENINLFSTLGNPYETAKNSRIAAIYYGRRIDSFHYTEGWHYYAYYDFSTVLVLVLCLYGLSQIFTGERESGMNKLLPTYRNGGRRTAAAKLIAGGLFMTGICLWFSVIDYLAFGSIFGMRDGMSFPIYAIENLAYASVNLTAWQYAVVTALSRLLGVWEFGAAVLLVSMFSRHSLVPMTAGAAAFTGLALLRAKWCYSSHIWLTAINPYSLTAGRLLYGRTEFVNFFGIPLLSWEAAMLCAAAVILCIVMLIMHFGCGGAKGGRSA